MTRLRSYVSRIRSFFRRKSNEAQIAAELNAHLELHIADNVRRGMSSDEARRQALLKLGGLEQTKELYRDQRGVAMLETVLQDLRYGLRALRKNLGFTSVTVATLILGIGANTAVFSMVNALLLHPYNFRDLDRIVRVWEGRGTDEGYDARWIAPADVTDLFAEANAFESIALYRDHSFNLAKDGSVEPVLGCEVSASFLDVLGVAPILGRGFAKSEEQLGAEQVVILGYALWQQRFGGSAEVLGNPLRLNGREYTVVGVMPPNFSFPVPSQLWVPLALTPEQKAGRSALSVMALARVKPNVNLSKAAVALAGISHRLEDEFPTTNTGRSAKLLPLRQELYIYTVPLFLFLQVAAVFVLLLTCANLVNLMFARLINRQKEIAMRTALGADRRRLVQLFLSETMLLSLAAGVVAAAVSLGTVRLLRTSISEQWTRWVPGWSGIRVDPRVLLFTLALAACVGLAFGLATALRSGRLNLNIVLKDGGPGSITRARARLRSMLVVTQVVFALVLLVCAGLMIQGFLHLANLYAALGPTKILRVEFALPANAYDNETKTANFYEQFLRSAASLQGVDFVSISTNEPASSVDNDTTPFTIEGRATPKANEVPSADLQTISPSYFSVLRISLISGRFFAETDASGAPQVAIVSRSMADHFWPGEDLLGKRIKLGGTDTAAAWVTLVGVVGDVRQNWWNPEVQPTIYRPFLQAPQRSMAALLRTDGNPTGYVSALREIVQRLDPDVALRGVATLQAQINDSIGLIRVMGVLMGTFGLVALALSSIGVYGVLSESVAQRTREIGIRRALGANSSDVLRLVFGQALKLTLTGVFIAVPVTIGVSKLMASTIYGLASLSPQMLLTFAGALLAVALLAGYIPARRAMRVDPMIALRYE